MLALDHVVFAGNNIEAMSATYGDKFNLKAVFGGHHKAWGTYNYLAYLSNNAYLEWLGIADEKIANQSDSPLIKHLTYHLRNKQAGLFQFALQTDELDDYINHFEKNKIPFTGPYDGKRELSNGKTITWRMLFPTYDHTVETLPFLIEWDQPESERVNVSLVNSSAITKMEFSGVDLDRFLHIYKIPFKKRLRNSVRLKNTLLTFKEEGEIKLEIN